MNRLSIYTQFAHITEGTTEYNTKHFCDIENVLAYFGVEYVTENSQHKTHEQNLIILKNYILHDATDEQINWLIKTFISPDIFENSTTDEVFVGMVMNKSKMEDCEEVQATISKAITDTGNYGYACNKSNHIGDMTVEIFDNIRACKFAIFDFTTQNAGAYYEAGYAKAIGKQVIFTCRKSETNMLHFDINHLRVILWEDYDDLYNQLVTTITRNNLGKVTEV